MKPLSRRAYSILSIALAAVIFAGLNVALDATVTTARLDLTQNGQFTLSDGTRHIIENLSEPVTLTFYYSKEAATDYQSVRDYAERVRDLLGVYANLSGGKIVVREVDPQPYTPAEDEAGAAGITGVPTDKGDTVYFGLTGSNRINGREVIAYFAPEREGLLEYDLTSLIYRLSNPKRPKIAVLSSLPLDTGPGGMQAMMQGRGRPFMIYQELAQNYDTQMLPADFSAIPPGTDVLMIVQPGNLSDVQAYAIDQFVLKDGRALVFVDPNSELAAASAGPEGAMAPTSSSLPVLFRAWGIGFNPAKEIGDLKLAQHVQLTQDGPPVSYPVWLHVSREQLSDDDPVTSNIQVLNLASAGSLKPLKNATTKFTSLAGTSHQASLLDVAQARLIPNPDDLVSQIVPTGEEYIIAARITGPAKTAFPAGVPGAAVKDPVKQARNINVIVMADSDLFDDRMWVRVENMFGKTVAAPFANNDAFVINAAENLMGSNDLISLRTRATNDRPFTLVKALQAQAEAEFKQQEDTLKARLTEVQDRLKNLQQGQGSNLAVTPRQQAAIDQFKHQLVSIREQLREVQHNLRKDIDALGDVLAFVNMALVPILVSIFAIVLAWLRRRRRARAIPL
ncbi:MAG TPA: Gldg family protein [Rhizomicrobium sp.]|nr:Gldg family protein [Rhizomicrobium sp.]